MLKFRHHLWVNFAAIYASTAASSMVKFRHHLWVNFGAIYVSTAASSMVKFWHHLWVNFSTIYGTTLETIYVSTSASSMSQLQRHIGGNFIVIYAVFDRSLKYLIEGVPRITRALLCFFSIIKRNYLQFQILTRLFESQTSHLYTSKKIYCNLHLQRLYRIL